MLSSLVVIFTLAIFSEHAASQFVSLQAIAAAIGALGGFLLLNARFKLSAAKVFLGDAGSTLLGFILVYVLIDYSQGDHQIFSPVLAGWILGLPLLDASAVIARRVLDGRSPFKPDRMHLHHRLIDSGLDVKRTVAIMVGFHTVSYTHLTLPTIYSV